MKLFSFPKGYVWNTIIAALKTKTLWQLGQQCFPGTIGFFEFLKLVLSNEGDKDSKEATLAPIYKRDCGLRMSSEAFFSVCLAALRWH